MVMGCFLLDLYMLPSAGGPVLLAFGDINKFFVLWFRGREGEAGVRERGIIFPPSLLSSAYIGLYLNT